MPGHGERRLVRGLRRWDLVALVINSVIGAGIFGLPSRAFALAGTFSVLAYAVSALAILLIILCFAEVASRFSETGGSYLYASAAFGPLVGFQVGWLLWLGRIAGFASLCNLFVGYLGYFVPSVAADPWRPAIITALVTAVAVANIVGVRVTTTMTNVLTIGKMIPLAVFVVAGLFFVDPQRYSAAWPPGGSFSQAALLVVFTYVGFEGAVVPAGETRDPAQHLPFALITGIGIVVVTYICVQVVCIGTLPNLAASERPSLTPAAGFWAPRAPHSSAPRAGVHRRALNALMFATSRILFAMGERRQLPRVVSAMHPRFSTPVVAIAITAAVMLAVALSSTFISALTIGTIVRLMAYAATCAALPALRRSPSAPRAAFSVPAGNLVALAAIALSVWLLSNSAWNEMRLAGIMVLVGLAVFWLSARFSVRSGSRTNGPSQASRA
jgi:amino acid transporter